MTLPVTSYQRLLAMSWPFIVANASVPLLGVVDTAVIGHTGTVVDLGAIALGSLIFSFVYWSFGFLRMGTTGFVAQSAGANDDAEVRALLGRSCLVALFVGSLLLVLQIPIGGLSFTLLAADSVVESVAETYFFTRIWGAPATLVLFVIMGVWIGLGESRELLKLQLFLNGVNMVLDIVAAGVLGLGAQGIALGTVIAEVSACFVGFYRLYMFLAAHHGVGRSWHAFWPVKRIRDVSKMASLVSANTDIMVRTLLLVFAFAYFTNKAATFGIVALATTHIVLQIMAFAAFFLDGFAYVAESQAGKSYGAKDKQAFDAALLRTTVLAAATAVLLALLVVLFGQPLVAALTDIPEVATLATLLLPICTVYIIASFPAFQLDGVFIGTSRTREMRNASLVSVLVFLPAANVLGAYAGLVGLWWAMVVFVLARAISLLLYAPSLMHQFSDVSDQKGSGE